MINLEQEWLEKARHGDEEAFTKLVETYQTPVYNMCFRMLGESGAAEDAAQETFWRAWLNLKRYDPQRSFTTWLLSIAWSLPLRRYIRNQPGRNFRKKRRKKNLKKTRRRTPKKRIPP